MLRVEPPTRSPYCNLQVLDRPQSVSNRRAMSTHTQVSPETIRVLVLETLPRPLSNAGEETIFGSGGVLDSLDLVNYLADLEYRIEQVFGRQIVLASESAMSRGRSPFRNVTALTEYILELLVK